MAAELTDKLAVVTGGALGIGGGVTRALHAAGATVVVNDLDVNALHALRDELGQRVQLVPGDIHYPSTVTALRQSVSELAPAADVLVNNVGDYRPWSKSFLDSSEEQWQQLYAINLEHVFRVTHALLPGMTEAGRGSIVNVSTVEAFRGIPSNAVYSAFNAGVSAFTKSLAVEVAASGIRVNAIAPDLADTPQTPAESMLRGRDPEMVRSWVPLGRFGQPDDYAQVVLFLAGDASRFVTGHTIPVDGGTLAASGWYRRADGRGFTNLPDRP